MDEQPWAPFSEVLAEVTKAPLDEVRAILAEHRAETDALLAERLRAVSMDLHNIKSRHRRAPAALWTVVVLLALLDGYLLVDRLITG